jgi:hypothetical protein
MTNSLVWQSKPFRLSLNKITRDQQPFWNTENKRIPLAELLAISSHQIGKTYLYIDGSEVQRLGTELSESIKSATSDYAH